MKITTLENNDDEITITLEGVTNELNSINVRGFVYNKLSMLMKLLDMEFNIDFDYEWISFGEVEKKDGFDYREVTITI